MLAAVITWSDDHERAATAEKFAQGSLCGGTAVHVVCAGC